MNSTKCQICKTRPMSRKVQAECGLPYCRPCLTEAEWENAHNDEGHGDGPNDPKSNDCWICFPDLNEAQRDYTQRAGTSREGMVLRVPLKAGPEEKAEAVKAQLPAATRRQVWIGNEKSFTVLTLSRKTAASLELRWDARGRFVLGRVFEKGSEVGRKVRNVSEALRVLGY